MIPFYTLSSCIKQNCHSISVVIFHFFLNRSIFEFPSPFTKEFQLPDSGVPVQVCYLGVLCDAVYSLSRKLVILFPPSPGFISGFLPVCPCLCGWGWLSFTIMRKPGISRDSIKKNAVLKVSQSWCLLLAAVRPSSTYWNPLRPGFFPYKVECSYLLHRLLRFLNKTTVAGTGKQAKNSSYYHCGALLHWHVINYFRLRWKSFTLIIFK